MSPLSPEMINISFHSVFTRRLIQAKLEVEAETREQNGFQKEQVG